MTPEPVADDRAQVIAEVLARWGVRSRHGEWSDAEAQAHAARDVIAALSDTAAPEHEPIPGFMSIRGCTGCDWQPEDGTFRDHLPTPVPKAETCVGCGGSMVDGLCTDCGARNVRITYAAPVPVDATLTDLVSRVDVVAMLERGKDPAPRGEFGQHANHCFNWAIQETRFLAQRAAADPTIEDIRADAWDEGFHAYGDESNPYRAALGDQP